MARSTTEHGRQAHIDAQAPTILAIETSTSACSVALSVGGTKHEDHRIAPRQHNQLVLEMIDTLMRSAQVEPADLDAVTFGRGPGSFTGVRIATGIAQGICLGIGIPVVPISTLAILAQTACEAFPGARYLLATIQARPGQVYFGGYHNIDGVCSSVLDDSVVGHAELTLPPALDSEWYVVGDGAQAFVELLAHRHPTCTVDATMLPAAGALLTLALDELQLGRGVDAAFALPVYLDGLRPWRKRAD